MAFHGNEEVDSAFPSWATALMAAERLRGVEGPKKKEKKPLYNPAAAAAARVPAAVLNFANEDDNDICWSFIEENENGAIAVVVRL